MSTITDMAVQTALIKNLNNCDLWSPYDLQQVSQQDFGGGFPYLASSYTY